MNESSAQGVELDTERFRLRAFIDGLMGSDELEVHSDNVKLIELGGHLDGNRKAVLFRNAGPEGYEVVGNVLGARSRIAAAFGVEPERIAHEVLRRLKTPQKVVEVAADAAPVQQVVLTGDDADLTRLPAHVQHALDGGPYISSGIDYTIDPDTGWTNVGSRRLMLRNRTEAGIDVVAPSDLRALYLKVSGRGERLPISLTLGAHPIDFIAASMRLPVDEITLVGTLREAPLAVVKCVTNDILVPADAEIVIEGYLDERGHVESEGPYGEFFGYYGVVKQNPLFHLTAITRRSDALFQTTTISGRHMGRTETAQIGTVRTEAMVWKALETAVREPAAVYVTPSSNGTNNVRVALRQRVPGEARNAIAAIFGCLINAKNVFIVDADIDVFSDEQIDWALATRFQPDRDMVIESGFRAMPLDPSLDGRRTAAKAGFDLTVPFGRAHALEWTVPSAPVAAPARFQNIVQALESEPMAFGTLVTALGSDDGREVVVALDELQRAGRVIRLDEGQYALAQNDG